MSHHTHSPACAADGHSHGEVGHILPGWIYKTVLGILLVLTVVTVTVAQIDFGSMNIVVAMVIASIKALLVVLFFMHLKYENPLTWLYAAFPIFLLALMIGLIFLDNPYRIDGRTGKMGDEGLTIEQSLGEAPAAAAGHH